MVTVKNPILMGFYPDPSICRKGEDYYIVTDRWQKFTEEELTIELLHKLESWCDEYLIQIGRAHV